MVASKRNKVHAIASFLDWAAGLDYTSCALTLSSLLDRYAEEVLTECDTAVAHGPGHQSISLCIVTGPHDEHYSDMGHEWYDSDLTGQIYTRRRDGRTLRLFFARDW